MHTNLTIIETDGGMGIILPPEILALLKVEIGDTLHAKLIAGGVELSTSQPAADSNSDRN